MDALEATANAILGLVISNVAVWLLWPLYGWSVNLPSSISVAVIFFALSWARSYVLRRVFRRFHG